MEDFILFKEFEKDIADFGYNKVWRIFDKLRKLGKIKEEVDWKIVDGELYIISSRLFVESKQLKPNFHLRKVKSDDLKIKSNSNQLTESDDPDKSEDDRKSNKDKGLESDLKMKSNDLNFKSKSNQNGNYKTVNGSKGKENPRSEKVLQTDLNFKSDDLKNGNDETMVGFLKDHIEELKDHGETLRDELNEERAARKEVEREYREFRGEFRKLGKETYKLLAENDLLRRDLITAGGDVDKYTKRDQSGFDDAPDVDDVDINFEDPNSKDQAEEMSKSSATPEADEQKDEKSEASFSSSTTINESSQPNNNFSEPEPFEQRKGEQTAEPVIPPKRKGFFQQIQRIFSRV